MPHARPVPQCRPKIGWGALARGFLGRLPARNSHFQFKAATLVLGFRRIPTNKPPIDRRWELSVHAPMKRVEYQATFAVPVQDA